MSENPMSENSKPEAARAAQPSADTAPDIAKPAPPPPSGALPVVVIGASAGGLEACRAVVKDIAGSASAAFVLVLHLDPHHDSLLVDLLTGHTPLTVVQATGGMTLRAGVLHVIPPGAFLTVENRRIRLSDPAEGKGVRFPIDALLQSLARDAGAQSACVVLSGTGADGSLGLADIHAAGGLVIAQDPAEAAYPGMPQSAIDTGAVDQVLATAAIGPALMAFCDTARDRKTSRAPIPAVPPQKPTTLTSPAAPAAPRATPASDRYDDLLAYLTAHAPQDLTLYKRGTLERRVARRMALAGLAPDDVATYLARLPGDEVEQAALINDLSIHVTSFFRDPAVFEHLSRETLPALVAAAPTDRPLRVWVAGCSTGEEAFSLAITFLEAMDGAQPPLRLQVLASDLDPESIATARAGFYPAEIAEVVSPERLARFFIAQDGGFRVTSALRDVIVFTVADLLADPPFSRIDLVSCRNVLIYLGPEAQRQVIARCCFALRPGGLLLLGSAEMPGSADACFAPEHKASRLWRRVGKSVAGDMQLSPSRRDSTAPAAPEPAQQRSALADLCRRVVLDNHAPAAVLINARLDCLYLLGPTERYLRVTQGHPDSGILGMLPKALRVRFKAAAATCTAARPQVRFSGGPATAGTPAFDVVLHHVSTGPEPLVIVCFIDAAPRAVVPGDPAAASAPLEDLETALELARSDLSDALRDLEHEVEAHSADTAEALSVNEEFQSTNEELLASKEELQSLNEELTALNSQLQETLERHRTTANDLQNVLYSTHVATLFLCVDLNIRFFTPAARAIFRVIPSDIGRPLADLAAVARDDDLTGDAKAVLATLTPVEREVSGAGARFFLRRIQPYHTESGRVEGVVITYVDITERKSTNAALETARADAERATRAKSRFLASASHDLRQPLQSMALLHSLLARPKRSSEGRRLAALLDQTLTSMASMLDSMLDVTRIDSGVVKPDMQHVAIGPILQRLVDEFAPQCALKGLRLRIVPTTAWARTDPQLLDQILRNLLSNALKYTPTGGILLGCRRRNGLLTIVVCDTGIGVTEAERNAIFDPYRQGERAATIGGHGLGLGLSIVQRLAQLMDHAISLRSVPDKGASFMITLPLVADPVMVAQVVGGKTASDLASGPPSGDKAAPDGRPAVLQTGIILLVEDDPSVRGLLGQVLQDAGHTVISRDDAPSALRWASGDVTRPDLLLTDFDLPGATDGLSLALDLPNVLGVTVPTILLTGDITTQTAVAIRDHAFTQITKPVMPEALLTRISDMMMTARDARSDRERKSDAAHTTMHVIDDDPIIRQTLRRLFQAEGWAVLTHGSAEEFLARPRPVVPACLLVENRLPGMTGVALLAQLQAEGAPYASIILTAHGDAAMAVAALKAGASDLIEKPASAAELLARIRLALKACDTARPQSDRRRAAQQRLSGLTTREAEVMAMVLAGAPNKIIAADLGINQRTVEHHRASVMRKTGAKSLPALVRLAFDAADGDEAAP